MLLGQGEMEGHARGLSPLAWGSPYVSDPESAGRRSRAARRRPSARWHRTASAPRTMVTPPRPQPPLPPPVETGPAPAVVDPAPEVVADPEADPEADPALLVDEPAVKAKVSAAVIAE